MLGRRMKTVKLNISVMASHIDIIYRILISFTLHKQVKMNIGKL